MSLRRRVLEWLDVDGRIRELIRADAAARATPSASEVDALRERVDAAEKKLKMTMGSVQASSTQLMALHDGVDAARSEAGQARQIATTARSTAESVAEGLEALEHRLSEPAAPAAAPAKRPRKPKATPKTRS